MPGASEYHDGQVNVLSCLPDWASCLQLPQKLGVFKFMFSLPDKFFIVHVLDSNFGFCGPKLDLRQYNIAICRPIAHDVTAPVTMHPEDKLAIYVNITLVNKANFENFIIIVY